MAVLRGGFGGESWGDFGGQKEGLELGVKVGVKVGSKEPLKDTYGAQGTAPPTARIKEGLIYIP